MSPAASASTSSDSRGASRAPTSSGSIRRMAFSAWRKSGREELPNALFVGGDSRNLPFGDRVFDGVRIDRSLQHISAPIEALREMVRVTRKGGRIVVAEPDWGTYFVYNGNLETGAKMARLWEKSFANPYIGREIGVLLQKCGVENIGCRAHALVVRSLDAAEIIFDLTRVTENCVSAGGLNARRGGRLVERVERGVPKRRVSHVPEPHALGRCDPGLSDCAPPALL